MKAHRFTAIMLIAAVLTAMAGLQSCSPRVYGGVEEYRQVGPGTIYYNYELGGGHPHYYKVKKVKKHHKKKCPKPPKPPKHKKEKHHKPPKHKKHRGGWDRD